jgi:DNA mismatch repair protein MutL
MNGRDGHIRVLPLHVANKIAAGEVVERPASVVKELVENAIDAGAANIRISIVQGGRKLVAVQDDGSGMTKTDALLSLERQATSKILDVDDIEKIDTLGFRGEAIPSIASVSRFAITTRRRDSDEGTLVKVDAGTLAETGSAGCPPGTLVEVKDLFCNVPARRKFLRAAATEEGHIKTIFTVHALSRPGIGFTLNVDGRELYRLAPAANAAERILELFGRSFTENLLPLESTAGQVRVTGFIERPDLGAATRRDQYIFVNGRPATSASIAYALREAYPRRAGETKPAAVIFIELPPGQVDVNVHPTKREVRFRDNATVRNAVMAAVENALAPRRTASAPPPDVRPATADAPAHPAEIAFRTVSAPPAPAPAPQMPQAVSSAAPACVPPARPADIITPEPPQSAPVPMEFAIEPDESDTKPWQWFKFLAETDSGYLLIETDAGVVTINPHAARERIAFERLLKNAEEDCALNASQTLLIPETVKMNPPDFARVKNSIDTIRRMGFAIEEFGHDTFKIDAVPQLTGETPPSAIISTIARDLADGGIRRGNRWREELVARSIARSFAGSAVKLTADGAAKLVEELCACSMPYVCPRGKPVMIFTSTRELNRKFNRE